MDNGSTIDWHPWLDEAPETRIRCTDCARWGFIERQGRKVSGCRGYGDRPDPNGLRHCPKFIMVVKKGRAAA